MADHGTINLLDIDSLNVTISGLQMNTEMGIAQHYTGIVLFDETVINNTLMTLGQFGIAGTGATAAVTPPVQTGQLYPFAAAG